MHIDNIVSSTVLWENSQTTTAYRMVWITYMVGDEEANKAIIEQLSGEDALGVKQWAETPMIPWTLAEDFGKLLINLMGNRHYLEGFLKSLPKNQEKT